MYRRNFGALAAFAGALLSAVPTTGEIMERMALHPIGGRGRTYDKPDHTRVRGKTYPQHGARECARRVRQMQKASPST